MPLKNVVKGYFTFSRKERTAAIVLLALIAGFIALPYFIKHKKIKPTIDAKLLETVTKMQASGEKKDSNRHYAYSNMYAKVDSSAENKTFEPFDFDPNTVSELGWHKLGLRDKTIHTLLNYRNKGGQFREAADINKIWGIRPEEAKRIVPYIHIANAKSAKKDYAAYKELAKKPTIVDVNTATIEQLRNIPGMGNGMMYRIIKYREKLGGFLNISQIKETYGINDSSNILMMPYFQLVSTVITKININTATDFDLSSHPYIDRTVAKAIVLYRLQHGNYSSVEGIKKIVFIKDALFLKISPYLTVL